MPFYFVQKMTLIECLRLLLKYVAPIPGMQSLYIGADGAFFSGMDSDKQLVIIEAESRIHSKVDGLEKDIGFTQFDLLKTVLAHPHYHNCTAELIGTRLGAPAVLLTGSHGSTHTIPALSKKAAKHYRAPRWKVKPEWPISFQPSAVGVDLMEHWIT